MCAIKTLQTKAKNRPSPDLDSRFDAPEPESSAGYFRQLEGFGRLVGLWIRTLNLDHMTILTQDEQPVFTLCKIIKINRLNQQCSITETFCRKWVGDQTYMGMR